MDEMRASKFAFAPPLWWTDTLLLLLSAAANVLQQTTRTFVKIAPQPVLPSCPKIADDTSFDGVARDDVRLRTTECGGKGDFGSICKYDDAVHVDLLPDELRHPKERVVLDDFVLPRNHPEEGLGVSSDNSEAARGLYSMIPPMPVPSGPLQMGRKALASRQ